LIAENILKWKRLDGPTPRYQRAGVEFGSARMCPNFLESIEAQELLKQEMSRRGFMLKISHSPDSPEINQGRTSTAVFFQGGREFESTQPYEHWAVCFAALLAIGYPLPEHNTPIGAAV